MMNKPQYRSAMNRRAAAQLRALARELESGKCVVTTRQRVGGTLSVKYKRLGELK